MTIISEHLGNLRGLIKFASPLPWQWATSNSTARLSSASGKDGDVVSAFRATDGVPCVNVSSDNMNLIASAVNYLPELLAHIDAQAERIAEQQAVIDQRNGECDRLINELAALREQKMQPAPVAVPDAIKQILSELRTYNPKADEYGGKHIIPGWADRIEKALRLNSGSKPQRFVVPLMKMSVEEVMHRSGFDRQYAEGWCSANDWAINQVKLAGGEIAE